MAAVSTLIDRIYRDFLNKPDDLSAFSRLDGAIDNTTTTVIYEDGLLSSEEENLLAGGALIEVNQELMLVTNIVSLLILIFNKSSKKIFAINGYKKQEWVCYKWRKVVYSIVLH